MLNAHPTSTVGSEWYESSFFFHVLFIILWWCVCRCGCAYMSPWNNQTKKKSQTKGKLKNQHKQYFKLATEKRCWLYSTADSLFFFFKLNETLSVYHILTAHFFLPPWPKKIPAKISTRYWSVYNVRLCDIMQNRLLLGIDTTRWICASGVCRQPKLISHDIT